MTGVQTCALPIWRLLAGLRVVEDEFILSDVSHTANVVEAGLRPLVNDSYQYTAMIDSGAAKPDPLMEALKHQKVPYLVLENTFEWHSSLPYGERYWPTDVLDYLKQNYEFVTVVKTQGNGRDLFLFGRTP